MSSYNSAERATHVLCCQEVSFWFNTTVGEMREWRCSKGHTEGTGACCRAVSGLLCLPRHVHLHTLLILEGLWAVPSTWDLGDCAPEYLLGTLGNQGFLSAHLPWIPHSNLTALLSKWFNFKCFLSYFSFLSALQQIWNYSIIIPDVLNLSSALELQALVFVFLHLVKE